MSMTYLGNRFEIHGGGADLAFPHHEAERAQSEGATGERPFVSWWMHTGMLHEGGAKMSKSLGNLVLVRDLLRDHSGDAIRHYLVSNHYRTEVHYDADALERSARAAALLRAASARAGEPGPGELAPALVQARDRFLAALDDDLDTPSAMVELESLARMALETGDGCPRGAGGRPGARARRSDPRAEAGNRPGAEHRRRVTSEPDDDLVPVSVRLGAVVPPEDPEDWTRPLTWVAALGMLAGPITALAWFVIAPPGESHPALPATYVVAALMTRRGRCDRRDAAGPGPRGDGDDRGGPVRGARRHHPRRDRRRRAAGRCRVADAGSRVRRGGRRRCRGWRRGVGRGRGRPPPIEARCASSRR